MLFRSVDGRNITVEYRWAHGKAERYSALAAELVQLNLNLIVIGSGPALLAAKKVTQTIPVVGVGMGGDPVGIGLVASLARPGGNITGVSGIVDAGFVSKWAELLKEAAPRISRVGYLHDANNPVSRTRLPDLQSATQALSLKLLDLPVQDADRVDSVLTTMRSREGRDGLIVVAEAIFFRIETRSATSWRSTACLQSTASNCSRTQAALCRIRTASPIYGVTPPRTSIKYSKAPSRPTSPSSEHRSSSW